MINRCYTLSVYQNSALGEFFPIFFLILRNFLIVKLGEIQQTILTVELDVLKTKHSLVIRLLEFGHIIIKNEKV